MSVIILTHPVHGAKVAISDLEADYDELHGWSREGSEAEKVSALETPTEYANTMESKRPARPARSKV